MLNNLRRKEQYHLFIENINSFIQNIIMFVCIGGKDRGLLWLTPCYNTHIQSLASLTGV